MHRCARISRKRARARFIASARVYNSCARIYAPIFMKFFLVVSQCLINLSFKFRKDPKNTAQYCSKWQHTKAKAQAKYIIRVNATKQTDQQNRGGGIQTWTSSQLRQTYRGTDRIAYRGRLCIAYKY